MWLHSRAVQATVIKLLHTQGHLPKWGMNNALHLPPVSAWTATCSREASFCLLTGLITRLCRVCVFGVIFHKQREQLIIQHVWGFVFPGTLQMLSHTGPLKKQEKCTFFDVCAFACLSLFVQKKNSVSSNRGWEKPQISVSLKAYFISTAVLRWL